jgi:hypothetical protein
MTALPDGVAHLFDVRRIGKCWALFCHRCGWRMNCMNLPATAATVKRLARNVAYHETFDDYVHRRGEAPASIDADGDTD